MMHDVCTLLNHRSGGAWDVASNGGQTIHKILRMTRSQRLQAIDDLQTRPSQQATVYALNTA